MIHYAHTQALLVGKNATRKKHNPDKNLIHLKTMSELFWDHIFVYSYYPSIIC